MKHRQDVEDDVLPVEGDARADLITVGVHVPVREHDPFGRSFGARGEQDHGRRIRIPVAVEGVGHEGAQESHDLVERADLRPHVLEVDDADGCLHLGEESLQLAAFDEAPRAENRAHIGDSAGGQHALRAG